MLISIIIPVYNSQKYLKECLESLRSQKFHNYEVILINDGSTDSSGEICDYFCAIDDRFVVYHKSNGGVSSARNFGIKKANGDWITFIDSDDTITEEYLDNFSKLLDNHVELIIQGFVMWYNSENEGTVNDLNLSQLVNQIHLYPLGPVAKLYKKSIIVNNNIYFDEVLHKGEDTDFNLNYFSFCENIKIIDQNNYNYRNTPNSLSKKRNNFKDGYLLLEKIHSRLQIITDQNDEIKNFNLTRPMEKLLRSVFLTTAVSTKERKRFLRKLFENYRSEYLYFFKEKGLKGILFFILIKFRKYNLFEVIYRFLFNKFRIK